MNKTFVKTKLIFIAWKISIVQMNKYVFVVEISYKWQNENCIGFFQSSL